MTLDEIVERAMQIDDDDESNELAPHAAARLALEEAAKACRSVRADVREMDDRLDAGDECNLCTDAIRAMIGGSNDAG